MPTGKTIVRDKHLLSLKDLNQSEVLEDLLDAGASSLKIEGRLKDVSYVKNVTAAYRSKLDAIFARRKEYVRASSGTCRFDFTPQLDKSFSRGFTHYFLQGRDREISSFDTPKSLGEEMGTMKEQRGNYLTVAGVKPFHNGDGVCFLDEQGRLQGFRINRVDGNKLYPAGDVPRIKPRTRLFRNFDQEFERILARKSAERKIGVGWELADTSSGFALTVADEDGNRITLSFPYPKELARTPQPENLRTQLGKLGNTPFEVMPLGGTDSPSATTAPAIAINLSQNWFIPASVIADWRRQAIDKLTAARRITYRRELHVWKPTRHRFPATVPDLSGQCDEYRRPQLLSGSRSSFRGTGIREAGRTRSRTDVLQTLPALQHGLVSYTSKGTFPIPGTLLPGRNRRKTFPPHF